MQVSILAGVMRPVATRVATEVAVPPKTTVVGESSKLVKIPSSMTSASHVFNWVRAVFCWSNCVRFCESWPLSRTALRRWSIVTVSA